MVWAGLRVCCGLLHRIAVRHHQQHPAPRAGVPGTTPSCRHASGSVARAVRCSIDQTMQYFSARGSNVWAGIDRDAGVRR
eukprot:341201-Rhodomonas_salina.2